MVMGLSFPSVEGAPKRWCSELSEAFFSPGSVDWLNWLLVSLHRPLGSTFQIHPQMRRTSHGIEEKIEEFTGRHSKPDAGSQLRL